MKIPEPFVVLVKQAKQKDYKKTIFLWVDPKITLTIEYSNLKNEGF
jgi:hypothetical protein